MTARTKNIKRRVLPISIERPPMPFAPRRTATRPNTKKTIAALSIIISLFETLTTAKTLLAGFVPKLGIKNL